ncbi:hypothetical protein KGP36_03390 [Patescibacteria group bacterium]|nr:hypothetical protein [Patescibacteria group bacterium]
MKKVATLLAVVLLLMVIPVMGQQTAPPPTPPPPTLQTLPGWNVAVNGSFSSANGGTNNGFALTQELRLSDHYAIRADEYLLNDPNTTVTLGGLEYRLPATAIFKSTQYAANASKVELFANAELGTAHATVPSTSPITVRHLAVGIGGGFDVCVSTNVCIRPLDLKYVNGGVMTHGGQVLGNGIDLEAGIGLRF